MPQDRLKVAVIGTNIGCLLHVRALRCAGFEVSALVGRDPERTRERADHFGIPTSITTFEGVIDSDADAVVVATPPAAHHPMALAALTAGKHVLCEKPLALDVTQAREMRAAADQTELVAQVVHPRRWSPHYGALRETIQSGRLGSPLHATFLFDNPLLSTGVASLPSWWLDSETGGGWLRNYASHGIDVARYLLGEFAAVGGTLHRDSSIGMRADDGYAFSFHLVNGAQGAMTGTCRSWDFTDDGRITGTDATVGHHHTQLWLHHAEGREALEPTDALIEDLLAGGPEPGQPVEPLPEVEGVYNVVHRSDFGYREQVSMARSFRNRILDRSYAHASVATFDDGVAHMEVIAAVEESARQGRWVDVERS